MFELSFIIGLIVGLLRGGSLRRLANIPFRFPSLILISFGIQILLGIASYWISIPQVTGFVLILISYLILLSGLFLNRKEFYLQIITAGVLLNFIVIAVNGGMPVSNRSAKIIGINKKDLIKSLNKDFKRTLITEKTELSFLGDVVPLPPPYPFPSLYSLGDIFIAIGLLLFIQSHLAYQAKRIKEKARLPLLN